MATDPIAQLSCALDQTGNVIAGIRPDQAGLPTPCRSWDVAALVDHLVHDLRQFSARAGGGQPDWSATASAAGDDWLGTFRKEADLLLDAWRKAGDLGGMVELPGMGEVPARFPVDQQTTEFAVHAWDLATATGQSTDLDPEVGQAAFDLASGALRPEFRGTEAEGKAFGPEVHVAADASIYDRLAGLFGRHPG